MLLAPCCMPLVVPYIGTWIETSRSDPHCTHNPVVPYIGTWIETYFRAGLGIPRRVVPYIGTWIETSMPISMVFITPGRTLYRYVD